MICILSPSPVNIFPKRQARMPVSSAPTTVNDENAHPAERSSPFSPSVCAPLQLGSAFRGRALAPDSNLNTNSPDLFNNSTKRRSTTGDLLASMLGSSSHWDDLAAQQRTVFGLASPTKLERRSLSQTSPSKKSMFFDNTNVQVNKTASGTVNLLQSPYFISRG